MPGPVVCVGEVLWDALPAGLFLGGAVANVAMHLAQLEVPVQLVSAVGDDRLGHEAVRRVARTGVDVSLVQIDRDHPTGFVEATIDAAGDASYRIIESVAWDHITLGPAVRGAISHASAVVIGSLAQRHAVSRATIETIERGTTPLVFDINLRAPFADTGVVERTLHRATIVKVNAAELAQLSRWFGLPAEERAAATALADRFRCTVVCITRGAAGAALWHGDAWTECDGIDTIVRDTVGAGDAFLARLLAGWLAGESDASMLSHANAMGAWVASMSGAVPQLTDELRMRIALTRESGQRPGE
jgi:fructokinase